MEEWNNALRHQLTPQQWAVTIAQRRILCAFSSAVDATYDVGIVGKLDVLLDHAADFATGGDRNQLMTAAFRNYRDNPEDRKEVTTVEDAIAELMIGYRNPTAYLKPRLKRGSPAEKWMRQFYIDHRKSKFNHGGGGASFNIAEVLAGLGFAAHVFWLYHSNWLAECSLLCLGEDHAEYLRRRWFGERWCWKDSPFQKRGGQADGTGSSHPVRLSIPMPFNSQSPPIQVSENESIEPAGTGRVIFQFIDPLYCSANFFTSLRASPGSWQAPALFCRWQRGSTPQHANAWAMRKVVGENYHRLILSGFARKGKPLEMLSEQCSGLRIHHEISANFDEREEVDEYCEALRMIFIPAVAKTAGMNAEELQKFTSWHGTRVFEAVSSPWGESLLQRFLRATKVREVFDLDWIYVHGNELDIAVVKPGASEEVYDALKRAMLLAKVAVFAALNLRSKVAVSNDPRRFEPTVSPKGFLALCRFAQDFARQFASEAERKALQYQILDEGYAHDLQGIPGVVVVPVYWPEPEQEFSATGAGDICSGIVAALVP